TCHNASYPHLHTIPWIMSWVYDAHGGASAPALRRDRHVTITSLSFPELRSVRKPASQVGMRHSETHQAPINGHQPRKYKPPPVTPASTPPAMTLRQTGSCQRCWSFSTTPSLLSLRPGASLYPPPDRQDTGRALQKRVTRVFESLRTVPWGCCDHMSCGFPRDTSGKERSIHGFEPYCRLLLSPAWAVAFAMTAMVHTHMAGVYWARWLAPSACNTPLTTRLKNRADFSGLYLLPS